METILDALDERTAWDADRPAVRWHDGSGWRHLTWREHGEACRTVAAGLVSLGVRPGDRVAVLAANRVEWHQADLATFLAGGVTVPVYRTSSASQIAYVLAHAAARVCVVEDGAQLAKLLLHRVELAALEHVVVMDGAEGFDDPWVLGWDQLAERGRRVLRDEPDAVDRRRAAVGPDDVATIVYTSGTTGAPKGVELTHRNLAATSDAVHRMVPIGPDDRFLSFLPLAHIAERMVSQIGHVAAGAETWFARGLAEVPEDLRACRPTAFFAVPRVWEKFHDAVLEGTAALPWPRRRLVQAYLGLAASVGPGGDGGNGSGSSAGARADEAARRRYRVLDAVVGRAIRRQLGLDRARVVASGGAPMRPDLVRWFHGIGLPICEIYGQTETSGPTTLNPPGRARIGTVGVPLPGVEVRLADDGEVLVRGPGVCRGYHDDPGATAELFGDDGWLHSGDLGRFDDEGYLLITGRKKDLIVTAGGKNVAPQDIELALAASPLVAQAVLLGEGRPYLAALVALDAEGAARWAAARGKPTDLASLLVDDDLHRELDDHVARVGAARSHAEQIRRWRLLPAELSTAAGELTPTLKVQRAAVARRHAELIEALYERDPEHQAAGSEPRSSGAGAGGGRAAARHRAPAPE